MSTHSNTTIPPRCDFFGQCGGCQMQDVPYEEQLAIKQGRLQELVAEFWDKPIPVHGSPVQWNYRNKIDMNWARMQYDEKPPDDFVRETVLGFNKKGKWYFPLEIDVCHIGPESTTTLTAALRVWAKEHEYHALDNRGEQGFLRILLHRECKRTGEGMVALITSDGELDELSFVDTVLSVYPATSIYHGIYSGTARGAFADEMRLLHGKETIDEILHVPDGDDLRKLTFRISPFSFFQTNTLGTEVLYGLIRDWVKEVNPSILYDLYGGAGGIAFSCSDLVDVVRSVEVVESATSDGEFNAQANGIDNVFFTTDKIRGYLQQINAQGGMEPNSAAVIDPPREGMTPKPLARIVEAAPPNILYISCKPSEFAKELKVFTERYEITSIQAVDLFPHTDHVEMVTAMKLK
jgi:23S rRNA (uracil1939-C5)-methyltransferase